MFRYNSTKAYKEAFPVAYRQWRADSHCNDIHGYALSMVFYFGSDTVDVRNWVVDFGGLKPLKELLQEWFDHKLLVTEDDPHFALYKGLEAAGIAKLTIVERTGCEGLADFLYRFLNDPDDSYLQKVLGFSGVWCTRVEVRETEANMSYVEGTPKTWHKFIEA